MNTRLTGLLLGFMALSGLCSAGCVEALGAIGGSSEEARLEKEAKEKRATMMAEKDGECRTAEYCLDRCRTIKRPLDCYRTGKAALAGRTVATAAGWKDRGDTYRYEKASEEHESMDGVARETLTFACEADHAESCGMAGHLNKSKAKDAKDAAEAKRLFTKGCGLKDESSCKALALIK